MGKKIQLSLTSMLERREREKKEKKRQKVKERHRRKKEEKRRDAEVRRISAEQIALRLAENPLQPSTANTAETRELVGAPPWPSMIHPHPTIHQPRLTVQDNPSGFAYRINAETLSSDEEIVTNGMSRRFVIDEMT
jgi:hypothetical protein